LRVAVQFEFQQKSVIRREAYTCCITLTHKKKGPAAIRAWSMGQENKRKG